MELVFRRPRSDRDDRGALLQALEQSGLGFSLGPADATDDGGATWRTMTARDVTDYTAERAGTQAPAPGRFYRGRSFVRWEGVMVGRTVYEQFTLIVPEKWTTGRTGTAGQRQAVVDWFAARGWEFVATVFEDVS